jgi:hypothetical protein
VEAPPIEVVLVETRREAVEGFWGREDVYHRWECPSKVKELGRAGYDWNDEDAGYLADKRQMQSVVLMIQHACQQDPWQFEGKDQWHAFYQQWVKTVHRREENPLLIIIDNLGRKPIRREVRLEDLLEELRKEINEYDSYYSQE